MTTGLPPRVKALLKTESIGAHTAHMADVKANAANSGNIARHSVTRQLDEPSPAQARAIDKILRLPKVQGTS